jgi:hypothetical protein
MNICEKENKIVIQNMMIKNKMEKFIKTYKVLKWVGSGQVAPTNWHPVLGHNWHPPVKHVGHVVKESHGIAVGASVAP